MSYRHAVDDGMGGVEYQTIETPDEDYDRMKQQELDRMTDTQRITMHVLRRHNLPTKEYPFATLDTEKKLTWQDWMWIAYLAAGFVLCAVPWIVGTVVIVKWMFTK